MFWDETAPFLDDVLKLGPYLGPSVDVSPAMTVENEHVLHRSTYGPMTPDEIADKAGSDAWEQFMARIYEKLWSQVLPSELEDKE